MNIHSLGPENQEKQSSKILGGSELRVVQKHTQTHKWIPTLCILLCLSQYNDIGSN